MKIISAEFVKSAASRAQCPGEGPPEVVLIGRSNVGKSSLINALTGTKGLARTSATPGKTRTINFYIINGEFYIVDLPGFGYAAVPLELKLSWERMIEEYMKGRKSIRGAAVVLDPRRDVGDMEAFVYRWLGRFGIPVITVLTKTDKLSRNELSRRVSYLKRTLGIEDPVLFSSVTGEGRAALLKKIGGVLKEGF